jgi:hypothetical protein
MRGFGAMNVKTRNANDFIYSTFLSLVGYLWAQFVFFKEKHLFIETLLGYPLLFFSFLALCLRLRWYYSDAAKEAFYVRLLTAGSVLWLSFNTLFFFPSSFLFIILFALLILAALIMHPLSCGILNSECGMVSVVKSLFCRIGGISGRLISGMYSLPFIFRFLLSILCFPLKVAWGILCIPLELLKEVWSYYGKKEDFILSYIAVVSFFCLFCIIKMPLIMLIVAFFWHVVVKIINQSTAVPDFFARKLRMSRRVYFGMTVTQSRELGIFQVIGVAIISGILLIAFDMQRTQFALYLSIWGAFLWNVVMIEIQLYADEIEHSLKLEEDLA